MFLIPGLVIVMYITKTPFPPGYANELIHYLKTRANVIDGGTVHVPYVKYIGWGIHIEGESTVFGTSLNYTALRLLGTLYLMFIHCALGVAADEPFMIKARNTLWKLGGATGVPSWGKFWLSVLNVYDWEGTHPIPPELWLLPYALPIHPGRLWCHTRAVYLPMCYLYGLKYTAPLDETILALRQELYPVDYDSIIWSDQKDNVSYVDSYCPISALLGTLNKALQLYESLPGSLVRKIALKEVSRQILMEDSNTDCLDIGPVNKVMIMLIAWLEEGPESERFVKHVERNRDFMWMSFDGMMMNGTNGSQLWDTAFVVQSILSGKLGTEAESLPILEKCLQFLDKSQMVENPKYWKESYRHSSKGAWPFSTREQGYTVSDCTAEALKAVLLLQNGPFSSAKRISDERIFDAINILLSLQNSNGGFASYELQRGPEWLELLNPAQVFGTFLWHL
jgi:lanosterol synthase